MSSQLAQGRPTDRFNREKQRQIDKYVAEKFHAARRENGTVHDSNLREWALEKSVEVFNIA